MNKILKAPAIVLLLGCCSVPAFAYDPTPTYQDPLSFTPATNTVACPNCLTTDLPQDANTVLAGPTSGAAANPTYRALVGADLPTPQSAALGGVFSIAPVTHDFLTSIGTSGQPTQARPAFTDISGQATNAQLATQSANTVLGALTATTPSGLAMPSCSSVGEFLNWTSGTGFGCVTAPGAVDTGSAGQVAYYPNDGTTVVGTSSMYFANGNVGIGTATSLDTLDVFGAVSIGTGFVGTSAAQTNGLNVQGPVGFGTSGLASAALTILGTANGDLRVYRAGHYLALNGPGGGPLMGDLLYDSTRIMGVNASGVAIGTTYSGGVSIPVNGLLVQGSVGIGTATPSSALTVNGTATVTSLTATGDLTGNRLFVGSSGQFNIGTDGSASTSGTLASTNAINLTQTTGNGILTVQGHQQSGGGSYVKLRDDTLGNYGYIGENAAIQGGTSYNELLITNPQVSGTICIASNGGGSSTANTNCDILVNATDAVSIYGTHTNDNAPAGYVGEYLTATTSAGAITSGVQTNAVSLSLTAGDWDVTGTACGNPASTTIAPYIGAGFSTISATLPTLPSIQFSGSNLSASGSGISFCFSAAPIRMNLNATTTVFFVLQINYNTSTLTQTSTMSARRVR